MFKRNLTINNPMLQKKKPILSKESADDFTPSSLPPLDSDYNSTSDASRGASSKGTNAGLPSWLGQRPATLDERFQLSINSNRQNNETPEKSNVILNDVLSKKYASAILEATGRLKQTTGKADSADHKATDSADSAARPKNGDTTDSREKATTPAVPVSVLTEEQSELAAIVDKLPEDFDLSKWDKMTALQQQNALKKSGLSGVDQMKLLNAPTSIETIATIQYIQTNRAQYGITQARADEISSELLKIANARIGVNNRALPFASDFQRNLFLNQLDKEEQKLLESVGGQEDNHSDMLLNDEQTFDSTKRKFPDRRGIVRRVETYSKVALLAKDLLKAFIGVQYILPSALALLPMKAAGKLIDEGTISLGMQDNASIFYVGGANGSMGLAMDSTGDIGALRTQGKYLGVPSAAITVFASVSDADRLRDLEGQSIVVGGSIGEILTIGADLAFFTDQSGEKKFAVSLELGLGISQLPVEGHVGGSKTLGFVDPTGEDETWKIYNIYNAWEEYVKKVLEW